MTIYSQSPVGRRISLNLKLIPIAFAGVAFAVAWFFTGELRLVLEGILATRALSWLWNWWKHSVVRYETDLDSVRIIRPWPFDEIVISSSAICRVRYRNLLSCMYVASCQAGGRFPWTYIRRSATIPLLEEHELDESNLNSCNCLYWEPGTFGYYAYPPLKTDIEVLTFVSNADNIVVLEGPVNYVISPDNPDKFVEELRKMIDNIDIQGMVGI